MSILNHNPGYLGFKNAFAYPGLIFKPKYNSFVDYMSVQWLLNKFANVEKLGQIPELRQMHLAFQFGIHVVNPNMQYISMM